MLHHQSLNIAGLIRGVHTGLLIQGERERDSQGRCSDRRYRKYFGERESGRGVSVGHGEVHAYGRNQVR